jgi:hypothetical protein
MTGRNFWALLLADEGCVFEVRVRSEGRPALCWIPCHQPAAFCRMLGADDAEIGAVPRTRQDAWYLGRSRVAWVRLETGDSERRLRSFPVAPTLVIREGLPCRRWALWGLSRPLLGDWITRANERLSYALHGVRKAGDAATLIPSPFTSISRGRSKPINCWTEFETNQWHEPRKLLGSLPDAPEIRWQRAA